MPWFVAGGAHPSPHSVQLLSEVVDAWMANLLCLSFVDVFRPSLLDFNSFLGIFLCDVVTKLPYRSVNYGTFLQFILKGCRAECRRTVDGEKG